MSIPKANIPSQNESPCHSQNPSVQAKARESFVLPGIAFALEMLHKTLARLSVRHREALFSWSEKAPMLLQL